MGKKLPAVSWWNSEKNDSLYEVYLESSKENYGVWAPTLKEFLKEPIVFGWRVMIFISLHPKNISFLSQFLGIEGIKWNYKCAKEKSPNLIKILENFRSLIP